MFIDMQWPVLKPKPRNMELLEDNDKISIFSIMFICFLCKD